MPTTLDPWAMSAMATCREVRIEHVLAKRWPLLVWKNTIHILGPHQGDLHHHNDNERLIR